MLPPALRSTEVLEPGLSPKWQLQRDGCNYGNLVQRDASITSKSRAVHLLCDSFDGSGQTGSICISKGAWASHSNSVQSLGWGSASRWGHGCRMRKKVFGVVCHSPQQFQLCLEVARLVCRQHYPLWRTIVDDATIPREDTLEPDQSSGRFVFIKETLEKCVRLSYYDRIKGSVPPSFIGQLLPATAPGPRFKYEDLETTGGGSQLFK